jgi:hypothetical protein
MSNSVACHGTHRPNVLNAARHQRDAGSSQRPLQTRSHQAAVRHVLNVGSKNSTNARALAVAARPVANSAQQVERQGLHCNRTARTVPDRSSGLKQPLRRDGRAHIGKHRGPHAFRGGHPQSALNGDGQFRTVAPKRPDAAFALEMEDGLLARFTRRGRRAGRWK